MQGETPDPENDMRMINELLEMLKRDDEFETVFCLWNAGAVCFLAIFPSLFIRLQLYVFSASIKREEKRKADIGNVDTEITHKEEILEHLKRNIRQYQTLLEENETLVRELQSLEV